MAAGSGDYASPFRGQGLEFHEVREYHFGDDIRSIDWRVTARTDKPHVKVFTEERERTVILCVDANAACASEPAEHSSPYRLRARRPCLAGRPTAATTASAALSSETCRVACS